MKLGSKNILKLPGLVDVHVHLREPGATHKEDFESGTKAAVAGGYTQILDMPNNLPPTVIPRAFEQKIKLASGRIWCDVGFNFGGTVESSEFFHLIFKGVFCLKVYMNQTTGTLLVDKSKDRELIFKKWNSEKPIMVHAEGATIEIAIKLAKKYQKRLHVCHIECDQVKSVEKAKREGLKITSEICPHHLFLCKEDIEKIGPLGLMKPPLPTKSDQEKLWRNLDKIDIIATDHAPHTLKEKYDQSSPASPGGGQGGPKFGVPGLETALPLMISAVDEGKLTLDRLIKMMSTNPRKIFNLPTQPKTYVVVDTSQKFKISNKGLFTKCGWTPFVGMEGRGKIKKVVIRDYVVFKNGQFVGKPQGKVVRPSI